VIKKNNILFWFFFGFGTVFYYILKFNSHHITRGLFEQNHFDLLNKICSFVVPQPLDVYLGRMEVALFGPAQMLISGVLFMIICWRYLLKADTKPFLIAVFTYLFLTKFEILFYPPYGDAIGGPFAEAIWLSHNNFNFVGLFHQPDFIHGGPKVYLFTFYPAYLAFLMGIMPSVKTFLFVNHLLVFLYAAVIIAYFRKIAGLITDDKKSMLMALLILSLPIFQSQAEAINMEIPVLLFGVLSIHALMHKRIKAACLFSIVAVMVKGYAITIAGTVFVVGMMLFFFDEKLRFRFQTIFWSVLAFAALMAQGLASYAVFNEGGEVDMIGLFQGWDSFKIFLLTYAYFAAAAGFLAIFLMDCFKQKRSFSQALAQSISKHYSGLVIFAAAAAWYVVFLNSFTVSPRYQLLLMPFAFFSLVYLLIIIPSARRWLTVTLSFAVAFSWMTTYGLLYERLEGNDHVLLERSLEYRHDMELNLKFIKEIQEEYSDFVIGAPFVYAQMFALPELGYVREAREVVVYGMPCVYGNIKTFDGLASMNVARTIWIGLDRLMSRELEYPMGPDDKFMKDFYSGDRRAYLFMGGFAIERVYRYLETIQRNQLQNRSETNSL
jgi:hypothetical protein